MAQPDPKDAAVVARLGEAARPYDLLLTGGRVLDPDSGLDGRFDVAFAGDRVVAIETRIDPGLARQVVAVDGALVTPGLIDPHVHVCQGIGDSISPDSVGVGRGVTTVVDAGTCGVNNFGAFKPVMAASKTRILAWLNLSSIGQTDNALGECLFLPLLRVEQAVATAKANPDTIVGFKARLSSYVAGAADLAVLKLLLEAGEAADLPVMVHVGDTQSPLPKILELLRTGDWVSHYLTPRKYGILGTGATPNGKILPEAFAARRRGVILDTAMGRSQVGFPQMQAAVEQGLLPDTLSSDITIPAAADPSFGVVYVANQLMSFGVSFEELLPRMSLNPARALGKDGPGLGKLRVNGLGDATVLRLESGDFAVRDGNDWIRKTDRRLVATGVVRAGSYTALNK